MAEDFAICTEFIKFDKELGIALGFAIISKIDGEPYFDIQGDHVPEPALIQAATDFMRHSRVGKTMHQPAQTGDVIFAFPLTNDIAKSLEISTKRTGLLIGFKPTDLDTRDRLSKGEFTGFSIGGRYLINEEAA